MRFVKVLFRLSITLARVQSVMTYDANISSEDYAAGVAAPWFVWWQCREILEVTWFVYPRGWEPWT